MKTVELDAIRGLIKLPGSSLYIGDFEEHIQMPAVRESLNTWYEQDCLAGTPFAMFHRTLFGVLHGTLFAMFH